MTITNNFLCIQLSSCQVIKIQMKRREKNSINVNDEIIYKLTEDIRTSNGILYRLKPINSIMAINDLISIYFFYIHTCIFLLILRFNVPFTTILILCNLTLRAAQQNCI